MGEAITTLANANGPATEGGSLSAMGGGNLTWVKDQVGRKDRWFLMRQRGVVVWFTGLSGSGKSTLAMALDAQLHTSGFKSYVLDGDNLRHGLCSDLGFTESDRMENIRRAGEVACLMADAGLIVIGALISPFRHDRAQIRASCQALGNAFIEVYVNSPLNVCERRDPKGLYRKAREGQIKGFTGIDSPYEPPASAEIELHTDREAILESLQRLLAGVLEKTRLAD